MGTFMGHWQNDAVHMGSFKYYVIHFRQFLDPYKMDNEKREQLLKLKINFGE